MLPQASSHALSRASIALGQGSGVWGQGSGAGRVRASQSRVGLPVRGLRDRWFSQPATRKRQEMAGDGRRRKEMAFPLHTSCTALTLYSDLPCP